MHTQIFTHTHTDTRWHSVRGLTNCYIPLFTRRCAPCPSTPPSHPFFLRSSVYISLPYSSLLLYHCPLPQITESLKGQRETLKKRENRKQQKKKKKEGKALVGVCLSFPLTKDQWASISYLSTRGQRMSSQLARSTWRKSGGSNSNCSRDDYDNSRSDKREKGKRLRRRQKKNKNRQNNCEQHQGQR